jgi:acyl-coenzyme A synthetase/AMP-(fatty) acid ligase
VNFSRDIVDRMPPGRPALIELSASGERRVWTFGEVSDTSARLAGRLLAVGAKRGDVVMTLIGNRPEWVIGMLACFRVGIVALPCTEQLRAKDLALRLEAAHPRVVLVDPRNLAELSAAIELSTAGGAGSPVVLALPGEDLLAGTPAPAVELSEKDDCLITFTSGTSGPPKGVVHGQRYLLGQRLQAESWLGSGPGDVVWCTASSGWSKSARNSFIAPWLTGATALLFDGRFDPEERLAIVEQEEVAVWCMAPTEYRAIARRARLRPLPSIRQMVAAGEALNAEILFHFREVTGLDIRDGFGQTETGQLTGMPPGGVVRPGSMGRALPGIELTIEDGELIAEPATVPTFFVRYLDAVAPDGPWRTGDRVHADEDGFLYFEGRIDDVIISSGYRIGPVEVESALLTHDSVAESAVVAAPDPERGSVVRAIVVLRGGYEPSVALAEELKQHVKEQTAPYKYPRIVEFAAALPKTTSGKILRGALRGDRVISSDHQ